MLTMDRLLWIPKEYIDVKELKQSLTLTPKSFTDALVPDIYLFEETDDSIGVPRRWGLQNISWLGGEYCDWTSEVIAHWPSIDDITYWPGQLESVNKIFSSLLIKFGALLEAGCGSGKTLMALSVAAKLMQKTLVLVHKDDLAKQWHDTAYRFFPGVRIGHIQQNKWDYIKKDLVTASTKTLYSRKNQTEKIAQQFGLVIVDEAHRYPARTFEQVIRLFCAKYRLGVSATFRRKDGLEAVWNWHIGAIEHKSKIKKVVGTYELIKWNTPITDSTFYAYGRINHARYLTAIGENIPYIKWLSGIIQKAESAGRKILVVSDRISLLTTLQEQLEKSDTSLYVGSLNGVRLSEKKLLEAKKAAIILATYGMFAEGTDVPELDTLILATPRSDVEQVVGRIQRPREGKKQIMVIDPVFQTSYGISLGRKRERIYKNLGFVAKN